MASGRTTLSNLPYPLTTDAPNVSSDIQALATALDGKAIVGTGTLSARPSASIAGREYYATDNGLLYFDNGAAWQTVMLAGAYTNLTLGSLVSDATSGTQPPTVRLVGDYAQLRGVITASGAKTPGNTVFTVPTGFRPPVTIDVPIVTTFGSAPSTIRTINIDASTGVASFPVDSWPSGAPMTISGLTWPTV